MKKMKKMCKNYQDTVMNDNSYLGKPKIKGSSNTQSKGFSSPKYPSMVTLNDSLIDGIPMDSQVYKCKRFDLDEGEEGNSSLVMPKSRNETLDPNIHKLLNRNLGMNGTNNVIMPTTETRLLGHEMLKRGNYHH